MTQEKEPTGEKKEQIRQGILAELGSLRDDWSDEIPDHLVSSVDTPGDPPKDKARKTWFATVSGNIELAIINGLISDELAQKHEQFAQKYCDDPEFGGRMTIKEDIDEANELLDAAINELESSE